MKPICIAALPVASRLYVTIPCVVPPSVRPVALLFLSAAPRPFAACAGDGLEVRDAVSLNILFAVSATPDMDIAYTWFASLAAGNVPADRLDAFV